jgi:hypothetical protein
MSVYNSPSSNPLYRLVQAVTGIGLLCFLVAGYLGLRALIYNQINAIPPAMMNGASAAALIGTPLGLVYLVMGPQRLYHIRIDWISIQLGTIVGGLLYGVYNFVFPFNPQMMNEEAGRRFAQGGVDGLFIGAIVGALVAFVNGRRLQLHRNGLTRYIVLYLVVLTILWGGILVSRLGGVFSIAWIGVVLVLMVAARIVLRNFGGKPHENDE